MTRTATALVLVAALLPVAPAAAQAIPDNPSELVFQPIAFQPPVAKDHRVVLKNGMVVYIAEDRALPLVNISITLRAGSWLDPAGKEGLAAFTGSQMRRGGTRSLTAEQLDERLDSLAAQASTGVGSTAGSASLNYLADNLDEAEDLPDPESNVSLLRLPRLTHPAFLLSASPQGNLAIQDLQTDLGLPESYLLYHGPLEPFDVHRLLSAWSWAAPALGEYYPLAIAGVDPHLKSTLLPAIRDAHCESTVLLLPPLSAVGLAALYRGCSALIHPTLDSLCEGAIPLAMTCRKPVVALATPWSDALVGPAGYLVKAGEGQSTSRLLGAALITVIVDENVAESLAEQAAQRSDAWSSQEQAGRFTRRPGRGVCITCYATDGPPLAPAPK